VGRSLFHAFPDPACVQEVVRGAKAQGYKYVPLSAGME